MSTKRKRSDSKSDDHDEKLRRTKRNHPLKITDITQLCLENIFIYLSLSDLLNVADSNKILATATHAPFAQLYARKMIRIQQWKSKTNRYPPFNVGVDDIEVYTFKMSLKMLRHFGGQIKRLDMNYDLQLNNALFNYRTVSKYVNTYSRNSLKKLEIRPVLTFKYFSQSFSNVESLKIGKCALKEIDLCKMFPNLRSLEFEDFIPNIKAESNRFSQLSHFKISLYQQPSIARQLAAASVLKLIPKLKKLDIITENFEFYEENMDKLQTIESLNITLFDWPSQFTGNAILLRNVRRLEMTFITLEDNLKPTIPFSIDNLKEFAIGGIYRFSDSVYAFLSANPSIEKLVLNQAYLISGIDYTKLHNVMPSMTEIILPYSKFSIVKGLRILSSLSSVKKFSFICNDSEEVIDERCHKKWKVNRTLDLYGEKILTLERIETNASNELKLI